MTDFSKLIEPVARALLGEPNANLSTKTRLRFRTRGSMVINLDDGTYYDHENKIGGGVLDLVERTTGQANGAAVAWIKETLGVDLGPQPQRQPRRLVATYDYVSADGELLFQVCRYEPRDFLQRRPDGTGGWIWGTKGVELVPYRLTSLAAADMVYVAEGEKDCDNLAELGLVATTNPGGAGKWRPEFNRYLAGKNVVILPDNDQVGREHAAAVAANLAPVAASVTVVELPGLPLKGDVSDWLAAGGTTDDLAELAAEAPPYEPPPAPAPEADREPAPDRIDNIVFLTGLSRIEYDRRRKAEARRLGIRTQTLNKAVAERRGAAAAEGPGRALDWPEPEPWPHPVDGAQLLQQIVDTYRTYVVLPSACDVALALWTVHAHAFRASPVTPRLAIMSPEKRCGKTTTLEVIQALVPKPILASNITSAAVFRAVEVARPTLLIDEADTFLAGAEELRGVLNSGHRRTGEVIRTVGEDHQPRRFSTWAPVAIAAIGKIPGTLEDRSVKVELRRRGAGEEVERWRVDRTHHLAPLVRRCARWAADHLSALERGDPQVPAELHDRAADNWRPLLAIADAAGGEWPARARAAAVALSSGKQSEGRREMLLADIRAVFAERGDPEWIATTEIVRALVDMSERPWAEWNKGKAITPQALRTLLDPFKVFSSQRRHGGDRSRGYALADFADPWSRYLPGDASLHACHDQQPCGFAPDQHPCRVEGAARMRQGPESSDGAGSARMHGSSAPKGDDDEGEWL